MLLSISLNSAYQKVLLFDSFTEGGVLRASALYTAPSGKGINAARALKTLKSNVLITGFIGGANAALILKELKEENIASDFVLTATNTRTCTTLINKKNKSFTELIEPSGKISPQEVKVLKKKLSKLFKKTKLVTISGTLPPGVPGNFYNWIIKEATKYGVRVLADICKAPMKEALSAKPYLIKMNHEEFSATFGSQNTENQIYRLFKKGISWIIVTDGKEKFLAGTNGKVFLVTPPKIKVVNGVGSGDTMLAGLAYGINKGLSPEETLKIAVGAGAASALTIRPAEFELALMKKLVRQVRVKRL
ncbi:MAG: hypothetical protein A2231_05725 [Candidatus Firestonebacteria bacterium RIFOXYA2_FULL_40_8]|nr:MAG: hypothetical protein A2231_05725 [Candidatus Firestonebacteria bacterium RIFOXYA2_FULL_40_8]